MYCKNCFKKISSRSYYCKYCGAPVKGKEKEQKDTEEKQELIQKPPELSEEPQIRQEGQTDCQEAAGEEKQQDEETLRIEDTIQEPEQKKIPEPAAETESADYSFKLRSEKEKEFPVSPKVIRIGIIIILIIAAVTVFMKSSLFQSADSINYNDYIGVWQERGAEDVENNGGVKLEILSVDGSTMVISFGIYDGGGSYNGIVVENIGAVIKDGAAYYTFSNDGYGNSGNGVLTFKGRDIEWKSVVNREEADYYDVSKVKNSTDDRMLQNETAEPAEETSESQEDQEYILPDSSDTYLTKEDLEGLTQEELRIARNEIMARHGRIFNDPELAAYFESKDWYEGTVDPETFDSQMTGELNDYELKNIALIQDME